LSSRGTCSVASDGVSENREQDNSHVQFKCLSSTFSRAYTMPHHLLCSFSPVLHKLVGN